MAPQSFQSYKALPSAIISDGGAMTILLWGVTAMGISEAYHLPPIGSVSSRSFVSTHDDTITLSGLLVGPLRYTWKVWLETIAESSKRGTALAAYTGGTVGGLILVTAMTIRTDMQIQSLSFNVSSAKRQTIEASITMAHMPLPGFLGKLLDLASIGIGALADFGGN
jgi:hypothetical protein